MQDKTYIVKTEEVNIDELNQTLEELQNSNEFLNNSKLYKYIIELNGELEEYKKSNKKYIKKIITAIISILASISISCSIVKMKKNNNSYYDTTKYTYTDGKLTEEKVESDNNENEVYIIEYGYWNEEGTEREIKEYDVSEYTFEDIKDYLNLDLKNIDYNVKVQSFDDLKSVLESNNEGEKAIISYYKNKKQYYKSVIIYNSILCILLQIVLTITFIALKETIKEYYDKREEVDYDTLYRFLYDFLIIEERKIKNWDYDSLVVYYNKIKEPLSKIINEIEKNEELRNRFVELFNENKYLLNEPNILLDKYNETLKEFDLIKVKKELTTINKSLKRVLK